MTGHFGLSELAATTTIAVGAVALLGSTVAGYRWLRKHMTKLLLSGAETQGHLCALDLHLAQQDEAFSLFRGEVGTRLDHVERRQDQRERDQQQMARTMAALAESLGAVARGGEAFRADVGSTLGAHGARLDRVEDDVRRLQESERPATGKPA